MENPSSRFWPVASNTMATGVISFGPKGSKKVSPGQPCVVPLPAACGGAPKLWVSYWEQMDERSWRRPIWKKCPTLQKVKFEETKWMFTADFKGYPA